MLDSVANQYHLSKTTILAIILLPFLLTLLLSLFSLPICYDLHPYFWGEGKVVETTQFIILIFAFVQSLSVSWRSAVLEQKMVVRIFYLAFGLGMLFIAGEEVAWGQQFLNFKTPDFLQAFNSQNELTFHNLGALQAQSDSLNLLFAVAGCLGIYLTFRGKISKIKVPLPLIPWIGLILALALFGIWFQFHLGNRPLNYPAEYIFHIQTETAELLIALVGLLYPWLNKREIFSLPGLVGRQQQISNAKDLSLFPLRRTYPLIALVSGLLCMLWLAIIPGEKSNTFLFGFSRTRFLMLAFGLVLLLGIGYLVFRASRDQNWSKNTSRRLNHHVMTSPFFWALALLESLGFLISGAALIVTYTQKDPFITGILSRLAPWLLWLSVLSLEALLLTLPRLLPLARSRLVKAQAGSDPTRDCP